MTRTAALRKTNKRGFSLTEFAIVLGVIGIILAAIWALAGNMRNNTKQEKFSEMLTDIVGNIRGNYAGKAYFESTDVSTMMQKLTAMNVFPGDAVRLSGAVSIVDSPFGEVTSLPAGLTSYNSLYVCGWQSTGSSSCTYGGVGTGTPNVPLFAIEALFPDATSCIGAVLRNSNSATMPGLVAVYINGHQMNPLPPTLATVASSSYCTAATKIVDFVYRLNP